MSTFALGWTSKAHGNIFYLGWLGELESNLSGCAGEVKGRDDEEIVLLAKVVIDIINDNIGDV